MPSTIAMQPMFIAVFVLLSLPFPQALADDLLSAAEIRRLAPGNWSGTYKKSSLVLSVAADGTIKGHYAGIPARGTWTIKRKSGADRFCLTFRALVITDTKCGELYRKGNNVLYGFSKRGTPRLWMRRS